MDQRVLWEGAGDGHPQRPARDDTITPGRAGPTPTRLVSGPAWWRGLRWWGGAHWADQVAVPTLPPVKDPSRKLAGRFGGEVALAFGLSLFWLFVVGLGAAGCGDSDSCYDRFNRAFLSMVIGWPALLVVCVAMFAVGAWTKRVAVKRSALWALRIGTVTIWVIFLALIGGAPYP